MRLARRRSDPLLGHPNEGALIRARGRPPNAQHRSRDSVGGRSMSEGQDRATQATRPVSRRAGERVSFYVWTALVLAAAVAIVVLGWHAKGGTTDPTDVHPGHRLAHTAGVDKSAIP